MPHCPARGSRAHQREEAFGDLAVAALVQAAKAGAEAVVVAEHLLDLAVWRYEHIALAVAGAVL